MKRTCKCALAATLVCLALGAQGCIIARTTGKVVGTAVRGVGKVVGGTVKGVTAVL